MSFPRRCPCGREPFSWIRYGAVSRTYGNAIWYCHRSGTCMWYAPPASRRWTHVFAQGTHSPETESRA